MTIKSSKPSAARLWFVKAEHPYVATFAGADARARADALASEMGGYEVKPKPTLGATRPVWKRCAC